MQSRREAIYRYTSGVHYFSNNSTARSQLFCLYYGCHTSRHRSDLFQDIRLVFLLKSLLRVGLSHPTLPLLIPQRHFKPKQRLEPLIAD